VGWGALASKALKRLPSGAVRARSRVSRAPPAISGRPIDEYGELVQATIVFVEPDEVDDADGAGDSE